MLSGKQYFSVPWTSDFLVCGIWILAMAGCACVGIAAGGLLGATLETSLMCRYSASLLAEKAMLPCNVFSRSCWLCARQG